MRRLLRTAAVLLFQALIVRPVILGFVGVRYRRRALVPKGPCLVVANHNSHLDAGVLLTLFPLRRVAHVHPVAAADYFGKTLLRRTMALLFMNGIPIERVARAGHDTLQPMIRALEAGESLILFPEGSRGEAGVVGPFRSGVGRLVQAVPGLLVVPVFLTGPERIWPRGQRIPVPLGIDANVGKPRTYRPDADARVIAEQVRSDVLALAPPPSPVPGARPAPPVRAAVCGIDPWSRGALSVELVRRLGRSSRTLLIADPALEADARGVREAPGGIPVARSRAWIALLARLFRTGGLYRGSKFAEMVERARMDESLEDGRAARFVVGDGSALLDLLAWAEADAHRRGFDERGLHHALLYLSGERRIPVRQWWTFARNSPGAWLLNVFGLARLMVPGVLVLVIASPARVMARRRSAGRPLEPHENEAFLGRLQDAYREIAALLKRRGVEVFEIEDGALTPEADAARVEEACLRLAEKTGERAEPAPADGAGGGGSTR
ncbi:MAG: 1-acyl-sn-glycerol-3-phosphate acyltransferase [Acidobacteriia bacterium]|nr:1-acyl-sn-glycerol-3-phosphate acyltransferase [Terriglobia bacterium]